MSAWNLIKTN